MNKKALFIISFSLLGLFSACHRGNEDLEPKIVHSVQDKYLKQLPAPFPALTAEEKNEGWGKEYQIGLAFAHQLDLYQAITAFRRAEIIVPQDQQERKLEIQYEILLCYYMGAKYQDVVFTFNNSDLRFVDNNFPAFHDLLVILYDSYQQLNEEEKAQKMLDYIENNFPDTGETLTISSLLQHGDLPAIRELSQEYPDAGYLNTFLKSYDNEKKSSATAQTLNAFVPGAGYLYLGQKQSAVTAFLLNGLFIAAAYELFHHGQVAAGIIVTSFEAGWYFGGIHGAALETKYYNERLYERLATPMMNEKGLFPILTLNYAF